MAASPSSLFFLTFIFYPNPPFLQYICTKIGHQANPGLASLTSSMGKLTISPDGGTALSQSNILHFFKAMENELFGGQAFSGFNGHEWVKNYFGWRMNKPAVYTLCMVSMCTLPVWAFVDARQNKQSHSIDDGVYRQVKHLRG